MIKCFKPVVTYWKEEKFVVHDFGVVDDCLPQLKRYIDKILGGNYLPD